MPTHENRGATYDPTQPREKATDPYQTQPAGISSRTLRPEGRAPSMQAPPTPARAPFSEATMAGLKHLNERAVEQQAVQEEEDAKAAQEEAEQAARRAAMSEEELEAVRLAEKFDPERVPRDPRDIVVPQRSSIRTAEDAKYRQFMLDMYRRRKGEFSATPFNLTEYFLTGCLRQDVTVFEMPNQAAIRVRFRTTVDGDQEAARAVQASYPEAERGAVWERLLIALSVDDWIVSPLARTVTGPALPMWRVVSTAHAGGTPPITNTALQARLAYLRLVPSHVVSRLYEQLLWFVERASIALEDAELGNG